MEINNQIYKTMMEFVLSERAKNPAKFDKQVDEYMKKVIKKHKQTKCSKEIEL